MRTIPDYKAVTRTQVPSAAPWIDDYMKSVHAQIVALTDAVRYRDTQVVELTADHGRAYDIDASTLQGAPKGARLIYSSVPIARMDISIVDKGIRLTFWLVSGSGSAFVRCKIEGV